MPQSQIWEREGALQAIDGLVSEALSGRGRSLFIVGEAGLGKTTMVERARAGSGGRFKVSIGRGDAAESSLPFGIIDQALRGLGFRSPGQTRAGRRPAMQARAARLYAALQFLEALPSPTLLLLDDLHWADDDSLALLAFLCRRISNLPIALIGTLRPWPQSALDTVGPLTDDGEATVEQLLPLSDAGAAEEWRDRRTQPDEPAHERHVPQRPPRRGHRSGAKRAVRARERPEALADDHDAVRPGHAAEPRERLSRVRALERGRKGGAVHPSIIVLRAAVRQGPDGLRGRTFRTYQRPREKKPRSARTTITIRMIQRMPFTLPTPFVFL